MSIENEFDNRAVSKELMNELTNGGFKEFVNFVKQSEKPNCEYKLALCFRGNDNPDSVVIYYNNHMVWKLNIEKNGSLAVTISYNHARYSKDWKEKLELLCSKKFGFKGKKEPEDGSIGYLKAIGNIFSKNFVEDSFRILKPLIDDFFNTDLKFDYFKEENVKTHRNYIEKIRQQELYIEFDNLDNGLFVYDLEFAQKRVEEVSLNKNQPDMLGIRFKNGKPEKRVFIEVKSTEAAVRNLKSGLKKHLIGMEEYIKDEVAISNRIKEAYQIFEQYKQLNLRNVTNVNANVLDTKLPIEIRFILTDEAAEYFKRNKKYWENRKDDENYILEKFMKNRGYTVEYVNAERIEIWK